MNKDLLSVFCIALFGFGVYDIFDLIFRVMILDATGRMIIGQIIGSIFIAITIKTKI